MGIVVGGFKAYKTFTLGEIFLALHHLNGEPAMVLYPTNPSALFKPKACAICLSALWLYEDKEYLMSQARTFAKAMGMDPESKSVVMKIASAIDDHKLDLIKMPPEQKTGYEKTVADMLIKVDGKIIEREIKEGEDNADAETFVLGGRTFQ